MYDPIVAMRKQLADYGYLLDKEEARLKALVRLSSGANREHIEWRLAALQGSRRRLEETLKDFEVADPQQSRELSTR